MSRRAQAPHREILPDPKFHSDMLANQWGLLAIHAQDAWHTSRGNGVTVAVLDTGLDMTHPDLAGQTVSPGELVPIYHRLSQAERERLARGLKITLDQ